MKSQKKEFSNEQIIISTKPKEKQKTKVKVTGKKSHIFKNKLIFQIFILLFILVDITIKVYKSFYPKEIPELKFGVCIIGSNENQYAKEYIDYYKKIGVDKIFLYDNNKKDGERFEDVIQEDINNGFVEIFDRRGLKGQQTPVYIDCYNRHQSFYDWLFFIDFDEFFTIVGNTTLNELFSNKRFNKCKSIKINWLIYGDNDLVHYEDKPIQERFPVPSKKQRKTPVIKSVVRGKINQTLSRFHPHYPFEIDSQCNINGHKEKNSYYSNSFYLQKAYIKHYITKTAEEFVLKLKKGSVNNGEDYEVIPFLDDRFFQFNKITIEKIEIFEKEFGINLTDFRNKIKK